MHLNNNIMIIQKQNYFNNNSMFLDPKTFLQQLKVSCSNSMI